MRGLPDQFPDSVPNSLTVADFDYHLPPELIAQTPAPARTASRLLHVDALGAVHDRLFLDLAARLRPNDLLVFNDTRVIKARLFGHKASGGKVEVLIERVTDTFTALAHIRASKPPPAGTTMRLAEALDVTVLGRDNDLFILKFNDPVLELLEQHGTIPLPPYITHLQDAQDLQRYQTVYARAPGAVAAPTAGLHFDDAMLARLEQMGIRQAFVTLHVGAGTFQPVRVQQLSDHVMHAEWYDVPADTVTAIEQARALGGRVIAVGTTSVRALESAAQALRPGPLQAHGGSTQLFITPGFDYKVVDAMITNFHLPQSTLLMLVSAMIGLDTMKSAYTHAIAQRYRFFSYGDAMFLERNRNQ